MRFPRLIPVVFAAATFVPKLTLAQPTREPAPDVSPARVAAAPEAPASAEIEAILRAMSTPGGLTLAEARARAIESAPSIQRAEISVRIAEAGAREARVALFPDLTLSARATYLSRVRNPPLGQAVTQEQRDVLNAALEGLVNQTDTTILQQVFGGLLDGISASSDVSFPFFRSQYSFDAQVQYPVTAAFLTVLPAYRAAGLAEQAARLQSDVEAQAIAMRVHETYYEHVRAVGAFNVAELALAQAEAHRDQVSAFVEAGTAARADLLRVEATVAQVRLSVAQARAGVNISARALGLLMAGPDDAIPSITIGEDLSAAPAAIGGTLDELEQAAFANRSELEALRAMSQSQELLAQSHRDSRYPQLAVQGTATLSNPNTNYFPQTREFRGTWNVSAILSWSPNTFALSQARWHRARAELERIESDHMALVDGVRLEVAQAFEQRNAARDSLAEAEIGLRAAEESYRVRFEQFQLGAAVTNDLIDAQVDVNRARLSVIDAAISLRLAHARLERATGAWAERE